MELATLKRELKELVVEECDVDLEAHEIDDDERLIGSDGRMDLDSLDALSIALEVKSRYGKRIDAGNETRMALGSIAMLANFILDQ
ncbi:MAG: acyl carrier protein [Gammaproteobacteria bacterium]|nr:MAG: acyl carrier protein [Gammaproteobacteria bacterium]